MIRERFFFFSSRRRHTRLQGDWSSDVCSSDLERDQNVVTLLPQLPPLDACTVSLSMLRGNLESRHVVGKGKEFTHAERSNRSEERRVGKECRSRWSPYH